MRRIQTLGNAINNEKEIYAGEKNKPDNMVEELKQGGKKALSNKEELSLPVSNFAGLRFLLADDNPPCLRSLKNMIEKIGANAIIAANGIQVLELFEQSEPGYFDIIITDLKMPLMDGVDVSRYIRNTNRSDAKTVMIIALSSYTMPEDVDTIALAGISACLRKPVEWGTLYQIIQKQKSD